MSLSHKKTLNTPNTIPFPLNRPKDSFGKKYDDIGLRVKQTSTSRKRQNTLLNEFQCFSPFSNEWPQDNSIGEGLLIRPQPIYFEKGLDSFVVAESMIDNLIETVYELERYSTPNLQKHASAYSLSICQEVAHMRRDMIMKYDFAALEHTKRYLKEDVAAGDEEPIASPSDILALKGKLNQRPPSIKMETLSQPKSSRQRKQRGSRTSRYSQQVQSMYAFQPEDANGEFQQTFHKGSRHLKIQRQDSSPFSHRSYRDPSPIKGTGYLHIGSSDFFDSSKDLRWNLKSRKSNLTSPRRKPKPVYEQIPLQYILTTESTDGDQSSNGHRPSAEMLRRKRKIQNKGKFNFMIQKIQSQAVSKQPVAREEESMYHRRTLAQRQNQSSKGLTQPLDMKQKKNMTIQKVAFTSGGECLQKRDPEKVNYEIQKLVSKQKNEQTRVVAGSKTIVSKRASGFSTGQNNDQKYQRVLMLDKQVNEVAALKTEIDKFYHHKFNEAGECIVCNKANLSPASLKALEEEHKLQQKLLLAKIKKDIEMKDKKNTIQKVLEDINKANKKSNKKILETKIEDQIDKLNKNIMGQPDIKKPQIYIPKSNQKHYSLDNEGKNTEQSNLQNNKQTIYISKAKQKKQNPLFKINMDDFTIQKENDQRDQAHREQTAYRHSEASYNQIAGLRSSVNSCIDVSANPSMSTLKVKESTNSLERLFENVPQTQHGSQSSGNLPQLKLSLKQNARNPATIAAGHDHSSIANQNYRRTGKSLGKDQQSELASSRRGPSETRVESQLKGMKQHLGDTKAHLRYSNVRFLETLPPIQGNVSSTGAPPQSLVLMQAASTQHLRPIKKQNLSKFGTIKQHSLPSLKLMTAQDQMGQNLTHTVKQVSTSRLYSYDLKQAAYSTALKTDASTYSSSTLSKVLREATQQPIANGVQAPTKLRTLNNHHSQKHFRSVQL